MNRFIKIFMKDTRVFYLSSENASNEFHRIQETLNAMGLRVLRIKTVDGEKLLPINNISFIGIYDQEDD